MYPIVKKEAKLYNEYNGEPTQKYWTHFYRIL